MRKIFAALLLSFAFIGAPAMAADPAQEANHAAAVEAAKATSAPAVEVAPQSTNEFVRVADGLADALTRTASKLNVELQDFAKSPLGIFTMLLIVFKLAGHEINQWFGAMTWLVLTGGLWLWWSRKTFGVFNEKGKFVSYKWWNGESGDVPGGAIIAFVTALVILIVFAVKMP